MYLCVSKRASIYCRPSLIDIKVRANYSVITRVRREMLASVSRETEVTLACQLKVTGVLLVPEVNL